MAEMNDDEIMMAMVDKEQDFQGWAVCCKPHFVKMGSICMA